MSEADKRYQESIERGAEALAREIDKDVLLMMGEGYKELPLYTIEDSEGKPYISVVDDDDAIKLRVHTDGINDRVYLNVKKSALPALVAILASIEL